MKYLLFYLQLFIFSSSCFATSGNIVSLYEDSPGHYAYITAHYHIPVRYYIYPEIRHIPIEVGGYTYSVDARPAVERALNQWAAATTGEPHPISFTSVDNVQNADLIFAAREGEEHAPSDPQIFAYHDHTNTDFINLIPSRTSQALQSRISWFPGTPIITYVGNIVSVIMLHESGHALGLDHPHNAPNPDNVPLHNGNVFYPARNLSPQQSNQPHIMTANGFDYLYELSQYLGHPAVPEDVAPAEAENQAIRFNLENAGICHTPSTTNTVTNDFSSQCLLYDPTSILGPIIFSLLLN